MKRKLLWICLGVFAYVPFHALISTWLISNFGHEAIFKSLKDIIVVAVGIFCTVTAIRSKIKLCQAEKTLLIFIGVFVGLHLVWLPFATSTGQVVPGMIVNLRYLIFFGSLYFLSRELKIDVGRYAKGNRCV